MSRSTEDLLREALVHFDIVAEYAQADEVNEQMVLDAIAMRLYAGLEALVQVPEDVADRLFVDAWPRMRGLRNRLAHGYGFISLQRIRETVTSHLPPAVQAIRVELG